MTVALDEWIDNGKTKPIHIPKKDSKIVIGTYKNTYMVRVKSVSKDLVRGNIINTPPSYKHFRKGDDVIFHIDNIL